MGSADLWLSPNVCALTHSDPYLTPSGATPQVSACGHLGVGPPDAAAGASRLRPVNSCVATFLV